LDNAQLSKILLFNLTLFFLFVLLTRLVSKLVHYDLKTGNALILASGFPNAGNYGLPILLFAFGEIGMAIGVIFMAVQQILMNSAGVYYASSSQFGKKEAMLNVLRVPGFIAVLSALLLKMADFKLPVLLDRPLMLLGNAAIPCLLALLGMNLAAVKINKSYKFVLLATFMKLTVFPLLGLILIVPLFSLSTIYGKVLFICSACPTATTITLLATQFDNEPALISTVALVTTVISVLTVSTALYFVL
ncbi:MAG: hypothetical protein JG781_2637, partial [Peptococcaceae bacterium]|nr:hypothetical protein [Peptococcaceae bacterium]